MGLITKAYVNLISPTVPPAELTSTQLIIQPQPGQEAMAIKSKRPAMGVRNLGDPDVKAVPDYHVYKVICKAAKLPTSLATGQLSRPASIGDADDEFKCLDF
jgi:hypothetical protein